MGPKKDAKKAAPGEEVEGEDPLVFLQNYQKFCKTIGMVANPKIAQICNDEEHQPVDQLVIDDECGPLGPGGTRALMTALMGNGTGMKGGPYKLLKFLRIWKSNVGDEGSAAIAEVLRLGGAEVQISYLELLDDNIGPRGAMALGASLSAGRNLSLLTLKLDYNGTLGSAGCINLCKGLRTNITLRQLHMQYCGIGEEAGNALAEVLENSKSGLEKMNLCGNRLGGVGLSALCRGLALNAKLQKLSIADNMIDQTSEDLKGLGDLRDCLFNPASALTSIDLMYNRIGEAGAQVLAPALGADNKKITEFLVDLTLPMPVFELIFRKDSGGKKKGKKGKKK